MIEFSVVHKDLYNIIKYSNESDIKDKKMAVLNYIFYEFHIVKRKIMSAIKETLEKSFFNNFFKRFSQVKKMKKGYDYFEKKYSSWLNAEFNFRFENEAIEDFNTLQGKY